MKLGARQLRVSKPKEEELAGISRRGVYLVLDNVMDTYNVGAIFRLADAVAAKEVILCGGTEYPPNSRLHKAAVGTEEWVPWRYEASAVKAVTRLKNDVEGIKIVAVEQDEKAIGLDQLKVELPVGIIVGHETEGVGRGALNLADVIVEIPMWGVNKSLNVHVAATVVIYKLLV